jgi:hypothetical protein
MGFHVKGLLANCILMQFQVVEIAARDEPLGLELFDPELTTEGLEIERLGRVGGRRPFPYLSVGQAAAPSLSRGMRRGQNSPMDKSFKKERAA